MRAARSAAAGDSAPAAAGIEDAAGDARRLLAHALGIGHDRLTLHLPDEMTGAAGRPAYDLRRWRAGGAPAGGQIIGRGCSGAVVPRDARHAGPAPETELLVPRR
jgi:release factor glutamine methyltransferase